MNVFLLDLWQDLKEKHLWPVALALLIALIAVPVLLLDHGETQKAPTPPPAAAAQAPAARAAAALEDANAESSDLRVFVAKDPFKPGDGAAASAAEATQAAGDAASEGESAGSAAGVETASATAGGGSGSSSGDSTGGTTTTGGDTTTTTPTDTDKDKTKDGNDNSRGDSRDGTQLFTYAVGVRFGPSDSVKNYKNVQRLDLIPSSTNPIAAFLGVSASGNTAVFLIQAGYEVDGEGQCRPSIGRCSFLYLKDDEEHDAARLKAPDGTIYGMRLTSIRRVDVTDAQDSVRKASARAAKIRKARRHAGKKRKATQPRFLAPVFGDVGN